MYTSLLAKLLCGRAPDRVLVCVHGTQDDVSAVLAGFFRDVGDLCMRTSRALLQQNRGPRRMGRPTKHKRQRKHELLRCGRVGVFD